MTFYLKHKEHGNKHVATEAEAKKLASEGWTRWPRSLEEKEGKARPLAKLENLQAEGLRKANQDLAEAVEQALYNQDSGTTLVAQELESFVVTSDAPETEEPKKTPQHGRNTLSLKR